MKIQSLRTDGCFEEVIEKYSALIYRIAYNNVKVKADADDVFQEVFFRYFEKEKTFESEEHRRNWLINVTLKCCKKIYSSSWYKKTTFLEDFPQAEQAISEHDYDVYVAVQSLSLKYRTVVYLYYYEGFSVKEISEMTERKSSTVLSQLKRGREKLKILLKEDLYNE